MSRPDQLIYLVSVSLTEDSIGNQVEIPTDRMVYGEELYVGSNEFYNAATTGLRAEKRFEIYSREYRGENKLKHNGIMYRVIRTSLGKTKEKTWLTCERVTADG